MCDWMAVENITPTGVIQAINEFDSLGREAFLSKYGFGPAIAYSLAYEGKLYDSKAIVGAAHGFDRPDLGPLSSQELSGGRTGAAKVLESLGFEVETPPDGDGPVWLIRAGQRGQAEELALSEGMAIVGWSELGTLTPEMSREDIKTMIRTTYGEQKRPVAQEPSQLAIPFHPRGFGRRPCGPTPAHPSSTCCDRSYYRRVCASPGGEIF